MPIILSTTHCTHFLGLLTSLESAHNFKKLFGWGFCDIWNDQGQGKCYVVLTEPKAKADNTYRDLDNIFICGYH